MIKYKEGILKLNFSKDILEVLWNVSFFLLMLSVICFGGKNNFYHIAFFLFTGISVVDGIVKKKMTSKVFIPMHTLWYGVFVVLGIISSLWADNFSLTFVPLTKLIIILVVTYCLIMHTDSYEKLETYIDIVIAASLFLVVYIFVKTPVSAWFDGFLGQVTNYNTNDIGCAVSIAVILSYYKGFIKNRKLMYVLCAVFFFVVVLTSSRKSLLMSGLGIIMMTVFNFRARNYVLRIFAIVVIMLFAVFLIYQIPDLYNTVGVRIDKMIEFFMDDKSVDSSLMVRRYFIDMAKQFYFENPVFGIGLNNFSYRVNLYGKYASYAHNNYCEIAADLGSIGLVTYYWFYAYALLKLIKQVFDGHKTALLFTSLMMLFIVFEYGMVNYYKMQVHLVIAAAFVAISLNDSSDRKKFDAAEISL